MSYPTRCPLAFPPVLLLLLAAAPALAQPGASWTESGIVDILVYPVDGGGGRVNRDAASVLESDTIDEIQIGDSGLVGNQIPGTLAIEGVGSVETPRHLGDVTVSVGDLDLNGAIVDAGAIRIGVDTSSAQHDPSPGSMSILLSDVRNDVTVRNGTLGCQASSLAGLTVLDDGHAQVSGCLLEAVSTTGGAELSIQGSTVNAAAPNLRGTTTIASTTIDSAGGTIVEGEIRIGEPGLPVIWDSSSTITVGQNVHTTDLIVTESTIESGTAILRGGGLTGVALQGAATWRAIDLFQVLGGTVTLDVNSGSRVHALDRLWLALGQVTVGSGVEADSRIDVDGDFGLGNVDEDSFSTGTLTIEDAGVVDVDGTLYIRPLATLNLNGGTLRVSQLVNEGTLNENGGTLIVPEAVGAAPALAALAALGRRRARSGIA